MLGAGFDALVNERANGMRWPRGRRRYDLAIFAELVRLRPRRYRLTLDAEVLEQDAVLVAVGNATSYGGGMRMCPAADLADGLLDVIVAGPMSRTTLLRLQPRVYQGTHVTHPAVVARRARAITTRGRRDHRLRRRRADVPTAHHRYCRARRPLAAVLAHTWRAGIPIKRPV